MHAPDVSIATPNHRDMGDVQHVREERYPRATMFSHLRALMPIWMKRSTRKFLALATLVLCVLAAISLATWTISDPSRTFANGGDAENWMGFWGASFADIAMQFLGLASLPLVAAPAVWSLLQIDSRSTGRLRKRLGWLVVALVGISAALGCIAIPTGWPLHLGLGGVIGDAVLGIPRAFTGDFPGGVFAVILFFIFAVPGLWAFVRAIGFEKGLPRRNLTNAQTNLSALHDDAESNWGNSEFEHDMAHSGDGRDWVAFISAPLGLIMHYGYSIWMAFKRRRATRAHMPNQMGAPVGMDMGGGQIADPRAATMRAEPGFAEPAAIPPSAPQGDTWSDEPSVQDNGYHDDGHGNYDGQLAQDEANFDSRDIDMVDAPSLVTANAMADVPVPHTDAADTTPVVKRATQRAKPKAGRGSFQLPSLELLSEEQALVEDPSLSTEALQENARILEGVLEDFGVKGQIIKVRPGPVVTLYELEPAPGVKSSRVIGLAEDIARSMSAIAARVAVVPGRNAIGIELPNKSRETVYLREQLSSKEFRQTKAKLAMCLGKTIGGEAVVADLAKMPHLLMAGTTGSGKSVGINTMILSLLYRMGPDKCKMIMIDPKMLELSIYDGIPHLLTPVVVDPKKAVVALKWTVREMEERYKKMSKVGVRNIDGFNTRVTEAQAKGEVINRTVQTGFDRDTGEAIYETEELDLEPMPFIVVVIDEMADLMMVAGKDIEGTVQRLAQMARAAGIHVIMATQRPSVDVITGTIKANFPTRISFQVTSKIDSRTILGEMGAEQLLGMGDMLYMAGGGRITRVHGPFVSDQEVEDIVNHLKAQGVPQYLESITEEDEEEEAAGGEGGSVGDMADSDDPYDQAVAIVLRDRKASTSYIQRRLSIGYNRAASLIERMEQEGLISPANHAGKREILVPDEGETI